MFRHYSNAQYSYWNTNEWARKMALSGREEYSSFYDGADFEGPEVSPFLVPARKERLSARVKKILSADILYGGYLEDRSFLWRGSYMEPSKFLHLGLDFVAPAGTMVCIDQLARLVQVYQDPPGDTEGWGTRLLFQLIKEPRIHLVYGHLRPNALLHNVEDYFQPGQHIGDLGDPTENGGWSAHLHVQAIRGSIEEFLDDPAALDGYGELDQLEALAYRFPDPLQWLKLS